MAKVPVNPSIDDLTRAIRDMRREIDRISGGGLLVRNDLDMRGWRILNVGNPEDFGDVPSQEQAEDDGAADSGGGSSGSGGSVGGPYTDDALVRLDGTSGDLQGSSAILTDAGALTGLASASIPKLSNLTTNGFVKTSSGDGTLSVDTTTYQPQSSGVVTGGVLSINGGDNTLFDISAGTGWIVDHWTTPGTPVFHEVTLGSTGVAVTNIATQPVTYVCVDSAGAIVQLSSLPTAVESRRYIYLGQLGHANNSSIANAIPTPDLSASPIHQLRDLTNILGTLNVGVSVTAAGASLQLARSSGSLYSPGANYVNDDESPSLVPISAASPLTFRRRTQTGAGLTSATELDVGNYDVGGTITSITGVKWQNQRVYQLASGNTVVQYGQAVYSTSSEAFDGLTSESFVLLPNLQDAVLIGIISVKSNATDLTNDNQAIFYSVGRFGQVAGASGVAAANLAELVSYNNATSGLSATNVQDALDEVVSEAVPYPGAGIANSTGSAWGTSYSTTGSGTVVALKTGAALITPNIGAATGTSLTLSSLTSGRVPYATTAGLLTDSANLLFNGTSLDLATGGTAEISLAAQKAVYFGGLSTGYKIFQGAFGTLNFGSSAAGNIMLMNSSSLSPATAGGMSSGLSTNGWSALYLDESGAGTDTAAIVAPALSSSITLTLPAATGTLARTSGDDLAALTLNVTKDGTAFTLGTNDVAAFTNAGAGDNASIVVNAASGQIASLVGAVAGTKHGSVQFDASQVYITDDFAGANFVGISIRSGSDDVRVVDNAANVAATFGGSTHASPGMTLRQNLYLTATGGNGFIEFGEYNTTTDAAAPSADKARLYVRDNGAGKEQLVVRFATGAVQVIATEP